MEGDLMRRAESVEGACIPGPTRSERGVTLIEMMVTVVLLAAVILGSASLLTQVLHQNKLARHRSLATYLAAERIDRMTSLEFNTAADYLHYRLPEESASAGPPVRFTTDYGSIPDYPEFRRVVTLNYDVPTAGMLQITSEVFWEDLRQGEKSHELITYVHPRLEQRQ
jgi:prepilin-type N-terminal cleavage/methylation domain-containing protein